MICREAAFVLFIVFAIVMFAIFIVLLVGHKQQIEHQSVANKVSILPLAYGSLISEVQTPGHIETVTDHETYTEV